MVSYSSIKSQGPFIGVHCPKIAISLGCLLKLSLSPKHS